MASAITSRSVLAAALIAVLASSSFARPQRQLIGMSHDHLAADATDCDHFLTKTLTSFEASAHVQEQREIRLHGVDLLRVSAGSEGGIAVRGWDKPNARLIVCKYAASGTKASAETILGAVTVAVTKGEIAAEGPDSSENGTWWVNMILYVPRKAKLDVSAENGAIAIRNMAGRVTARATNGGISVAECAGDHKVSTISGGISLEKITGRLEATTSSGPIAYKLHDLKPLSLEARTDVSGEILCNVSGCADASGNWTPNRKHLRLGAASPSIRLSTSSAPIIIDQVR